MKAPQRLWCCALIVMLSSTSWARIGETLEECKARYGEPIGKITSPKENFPESEAYEFKKAEFTIMVLLIHGRAEIVTYAKDSGWGAAAHVEIEELLKRNYDGVWLRKGSTFASGDGALVGLFDEKQSTLTVSTRRFEREEAARSGRADGLQGL